MPKSVTEIGNQAFGLLKIKELKIPASVSKMGPGITYFCSELENIDVDPENKNFASVDGILYDKQITILMNAPAGLKIKDLKVPPTVKAVANKAFRGCNNIKTLQIPKAAETDPEAFLDANFKVIRY